MKLNTNPLKGKYPITVRIAGLCGIFSLVLIFLVFPRFVTESEFGTVDQIVIENIDIPQTQQIDNTPPPARPSIPVPTDDEDIAISSSSVGTGMEGLAGGGVLSIC